MTEELGWLASVPPLSATVFCFCRLCRLNEATTFVAYGFYWIVYSRINIRWHVNNNDYAPFRGFREELTSLTWLNCSNVADVHHRKLLILDAQQLLSQSGDVDVVIGTVVTIHNINSVEIDEDSLFWLFSWYGKVKKVRLLKKKPIAQVEMSQNSEAKDAVKNLQGTDFNGQILDLKVENYESIKGSLKHRDVVKSYNDIDRVHIKRYCKELMLKHEAS